MAVTIAESNVTTIADGRSSPVRSIATGLLLAVCWFALLAPLTARITRWRGDERFYTDAAIQMHQSGDWVTPRYADGMLRFRKPGMTYWAVLATYKLFGVGIASSRMPSLLAGSLTVAIMFWMGLQVYGGAHRPALAGAALLAATSAMFKLSMRATPDALLTLFTTVSCYGFVRAWNVRRKDHVGLACAYGGAALAVATKGLSGFLPPLFALVWCASDRRDGVRMRDLFSWPAFLIAVPLAGAWYALVFLNHGPGALSEFFGDQVSERVEGNPFRMLWQPAAYLLDLFLNLMPWSLVALILARGRADGIRPFLAAHRSFVRLTAIWLVGFVLIFSAGNMYRLRYLLPVFPLLCVVLGGYLARRTSEGVAALTCRPWLCGAHAALATAGTLLLLAGVRQGEFLALAYGGVNIAAALGVALYRGPWPLPLTAAAILSLYAQVDVVVHPILHPTPSAAIVAQLTAYDLLDEEVAFPESIDSEMSLVRMLLGGELLTEVMPATDESGEGPFRRVLVVPEAWRDRLVSMGYRLVEAGYSLRPVRRFACLRSLMAVGPLATCEQRKQRFYVAVAEGSLQAHKKR